MDKKTVTVKILYENRVETFSVRKGLGLQSLCLREKTPIEFDCRKADCGICLVTVKEGMENLSEPTAAEKDFLKAMRAAPDERLACQTRVFGDITVFVDSPF